jgi:O-methyltransferase
MHNTFITRHFDWTAGSSRRVRVINRLLRRLGTREWVRGPASTGYMTTVEMRMNLYHLLSQVLAYGVAGEILEVGTFTGETAVLLAKVMQGEDRQRDRGLHVYDAFRPMWNSADPRAQLARNFDGLGLPQPHVHQGLFTETIPAELPETVAFVHLDCGFGGDPREHAAEIQRLLTHIYPRMSTGAICSLVDYTDSSEVDRVTDANPGVKPGCDRFLADKSEKPSILYAAEYGHAYFRKM